MNFIFGAGGFAREVDWLLQDLANSGKEQYRTTHFVVEDGNALIGTAIKGLPVISESEFFADHAPKGANVYIALGAPAVRRKIAQRLMAIDTLSFPTVIHPSVQYDRRESSVKIGKGSVICAGVILTCDIEIGEFVHFNLDATLGHDARVGSYVTVSPGVHLSGNVTLGEAAFMGTGAVVLEGLPICADAVIGAGSVVVKPITEAGTYVGLPAKKLERKA